MSGAHHPQMKKEEGWGTPPPQRGPRSPRQGEPCTPFSYQARRRRGPILLVPCASASAYLFPLPILTMPPLQPIMTRLSSGSSSASCVWAQLYPWPILTACSGVPHTIDRSSHTAQKGARKAYVTNPQVQTQTQIPTG